MNHNKPTGEFFDLCLQPKGLQVRIDLQQGVITTAFKDWHSWHWDTEQKQVADNLIHFVEPDGRIVGTRSVAGEGGHE